MLAMKVWDSLCLEEASTICKVALNTKKCTYLGGSSGENAHYLMPVAVRKKALDYPEVELLMVA